MERSSLTRYCTRIKNVVPSAAHYVGYVEDDETPEMIMKKFEEMERIKASVAAAAAARPQVKQTVDISDSVVSKPETPLELSNDRSQSSDLSDSHQVVDAAQDVAPPGQPVDFEKDNGGAKEEPSLAEDVLLEVFKQTSMFNVKAALHNNAFLMEGETGLPKADDECQSDSDPFRDDEDFQGFWTDEEADAVMSNRRARGSRSDREKVPRPSRDNTARHVRQQVVAQFNRDTNAFIRRKTKTATDSNALQQIRVPVPVPLSWARSIQPYEPPVDEETQISQLTAVGKPGGASSDDSASFELPRVESFPWRSLNKQYQAVMIGGGWWGRPAFLPSSSSSPCSLSNTPSTSSNPPTTQHLLRRRTNDHFVAGDRGTQSYNSLLIRLTKVPFDLLCPQGFLFLWVEKQLIQGVVQDLAKKGFMYVENLTWVFCG
eukprot:CAMPEP_0175059180 /NCGR_PEP_ID=MMETSP0052_2-20121109/12283_1 /TAXON_ID=51329 ORGANISM="Polytomella parva, Strain SAG 63-3" /NCGR_SAMPLE_ID=MMETSP0052_2 /ASSEMBLY_ACC=CAM_ASM_000194 /LENGTH=430 /DNA_ID=CAMNT_0016324689 /DNA_START=205 /DNA_END=1494 /DNA_ORIENTATION=+